MYATRDYNEPRLDLLPRLEQVYSRPAKDIYPEAFILDRYAARSAVVLLKPMYYEARLATIRVLSIQRVQKVGRIEYAATCRVYETGQIKTLPMSRYTRLQVQ